MSTCDEITTCHDEQNAYPSGGRNAFAEDPKGCKHAEDVGQRREGICLAERIVAQDVHPKDARASEADATGKPPPVGQLGSDERP